MKRKTHEKRCLYWYKALVLILTVCLIGCQDDKIGSNGYDPSKPVVFRLYPRSWESSYSNPYLWR